MISGVPNGFEITVKKEENSFKATCSMFPEVTGEGKNEEKAIESLADGLATKMGTMVKTVLDDVLKTDLLKLFKAEAKITEALKAHKIKNLDPETIRKMPLKHSFINFNKPKQPLNEKKFSLQMPDIDLLMQGKNIKLNKYPVMHGLLMTLGLHTLQKNPQWYSSMDYLDSTRLEELEEKFFYALLDSGIFDFSQCAGQNAPFDLMLGIPISFN